MAVSAWANVRRDTLDAVRGVVPTFDAKQRWRHQGIERRGDDDSEDTGRTREFFDSWDDSGIDAGVFGTGEKQEARDLVLRTFYALSEDLDEIVDSDHVDLIEALDASSTYPSGSWGALKVRRVLDPDGPELSGEVAIVKWTIRHIYRKAVTLA